MAEQPQISAGAYLRLVALGALIGIPAALVAALFLALVHDIEHWLWHDLPDALGHASPPWYLVIGLPMVGGALVALARLLLPGDGGHRPLDGIAMGVTPLKDGPGIALAGLASLSFGAVLGPEAPLIAIGAVVGLSVTLLFRVGGREEHVLATAGSFSAISALFGGPLVGGMLMVEGGLGMGAALLAIILPGFVAAAVGYLVFVGFGTWGGLNAQGLLVPNLPAYDGTHLADLIVAIAVGILGALVVVAARRAASALDSRVRSDREIPLLLVAGGLAVGLLAQTADWLGADSEDVLFSGQASVPELVAADSTKIVLILFVAKAIAYAVSLGCGFRGGPVFPAIFLGIALATFATVWFDVSPTLSVAVGAAAGTAAVTRLLVTSSLFATLLVGTQGVDAVPAAVLAACAAWLVVQAVDRRRAASVTADVVS
jgi:chloride channel protein, CIC family